MTPGWTWEVLRASLRRDWLTARSYRLPWVMEIAGTLFTLVLFFYVGRLVDQAEVEALAAYDGGYFAYVVVGLALLRIVQSALTAFTTTIRQQQTTGTLEAALSAAASPRAVILGSAGYVVLRAMVTGVAMLALAVPFGLRASPSVEGVVGVVAGMVLLVILFAALGIGVAAFTIVFKQAGPLTGLLAQALALLSGAYFPLDLLPGWLRMIGEALPFTWGLDVVRESLLTGEVPIDRLSLLAVGAALLFPASLWLATKAVARARSNGSLGHY